MMNQEARLDYLIDYLMEENESQTESLLQKNSDTLDEKMTLFRALCNTREPNLVSDEFIKVQDAFLTEWNHERSITSVEQLEPVMPQVYLWQGDITSLEVDAIVNAANSELLGCFKPNHNCIDNIIHTRAGVQLRLECDALIREQGRREPVGKAKITKAYNLPSKYVIHTVGPFIDERGVSPFKDKLLASCYKSCLALADAYHLDHIAFCSISTGEFNFPNERAAEIALQTVNQYLKDTGSKLQVIFNVFKEKDLEIYRSFTGNLK